MRPYLLAEVLNQSEIRPVEIPGRPGELIWQVFAWPWTDAKAYMATGMTRESTLNCLRDMIGKDCGV